jgi:hypothetical protein
MAKDPQDRIQELCDERQRLEGELLIARTEATDDLIAGRKPANTAAALAERISIVDDAIERLTADASDAADAAFRKAKLRRAQLALDATSDRRKLAEAVDKALADLAAAWPAYRDSVRNAVGQTSAAGGDTGPIERVLSNNRVSEALVKALIAAGGGELSRAFGVDTPIKQRHSISLTDAEGRVAESLTRELLRLKSTSPQKHLAAEAQRQLEELR